MRRTIQFPRKFKNDHIGSHTRKTWRSYLRRWSMGFPVGMALAGYGAIFSPPAYAVNIILNFESGMSDTFAADPGAAELTRIMEYVESYYQDVIQDSHTITLNYWYTDITTNNGTLASHAAVTSSGGRETEANIRIDTLDGNGVPRPWWYDPTPEESSEFTIQQTFWRDLSPVVNGQRLDWYNDFGSSVIPDTFEVGYSGTAPVTSPAFNQWDILTSMLHEVGHALGVNGSTSETNDNDYDIDPSFIFGQTLGVETDTAGGVENADPAHIENPNTLMAGGQAALGLRRLPSHTDLFAMASGDNWTDLDVPRREFYGNSNWNNDANWSGDKAPHSNDDVFVRAAMGPGVPITAGLTADGVARNLTVSEGSNVNTHGFTLTLSGDLTVSDTNSDVFIEVGGMLDADEVVIQNSAELEMSGGSLIARSITIDPGTQLEATGGTSVVNASEILINDGQIDTRDGGNINFASVADSPWDLDGTSESGVVDASDGNLNFTTGGLTDSFDGTMRVGAGRVLTIAEDWVNATGIIDLNGGSDFDSRARLNGAFGGSTINFFSGSVLVSGEAHIDADVVFIGSILPNPTLVSLGADDSLDFNKQATITGGNFTLGNSADMRFNDDATVAGGVFTIGQDATVFFNADTTVSGGTFNTFNTQLTDGYVIFNGATTYDGGTVTVNGLALQEANATVASPTTVDADVFDMDGAELLGSNLRISTWTLNDALTVNADRIDEVGNVFNDHITINNTPGTGDLGKLMINLPGNDEWTLSSDSDLNLTGRVSGFSSVIEGSSFNVEGTATVANNVSWASQVDISGVVNVNANSNLRLLGGTIADPNQLVGGTITGSGTLSTRGDHALVGHGEIATPISFVNQAQLRADNGTLTLNGVINDVGVIGTADDDGILHVTNPWNTNVAELVQLRGGSVTGAGITNDGTAGIRGFGTLAPNNLNNNSLIAAAGDGILVIDPNNAIDLDGTTETGRVEAIDGDITIMDDLTEFFDGTIHVGKSRTLTIQQGWRQGQDGVLNLVGDPGSQEFTFVTGDVGVAQHLHGTVNVTRLAFFDMATVFKPTADIHLAGVSDILHLTEDSRVNAGATFTGDGRMVNVLNSTMILDDGASVGVALNNAGMLMIGNSPGTASVGAFSQTAFGVLAIGLAGQTAGTEHDLINITAAAELTGTLDIDLVSGFNPVVGDAFTVLSADTIIGQFDGYSGDVFVIDTDLALVPTIDQPAGVVELFATYPGDTNLDFRVDAADLNALALNWQQDDGDWFDADFNNDGLVNANDLNFLALNWQAGVLASEVTSLVSFDEAWSVALANAVMIPQPGGGVLLAVAAMGAVCVTRRRSESVG